MLPEFIRKRVQRGLDGAKNHKGMGLHAGKVALEICDVERMLLSAAPTPSALDMPYEVSPKISEKLRSGKDGFFDKEKFSSPPEVRNPNERIGAWLSAALDDPNVCAEMKADIRAWFDSTPPEAEPVGIVDRTVFRDGKSGQVIWIGDPLPDGTKLYTSPPAPADGGLRKAAEDAEPVYLYKYYHPSTDWSVIHRHTYEGLSAAGKAKCWKLYTSPPPPANDELRNAAQDMCDWYTKPGISRNFDQLVSNLSAALNKGKS